MFALTNALLLSKWFYLRQEDNVHEYTYDRHLTILGETMAILIGFLCYCTIFCPSLFFMMFVYSPIYLIIHATYMCLREDMSDEAVFFNNIRILIVFLS